MQYLLTLIVPNKGSVSTLGPRLSGYGDPVSDAELEAAVADANLPSYLYGLKLAADAPHAAIIDSMTPAQKRSQLARVEVEIVYDPAGLMADIISCMPDRYFALIDASSIFLAEASGGITALQAGLGYTRLADLHLRGFAEGAVHPSVQTAMKAILP